MTQSCVLDEWVDDARAVSYAHIHTSIDYSSGADRCPEPASDAGEEKQTLGLTVVKKRLVKLALTLGTVAAALLSGAANFKIG